MNVAYTDTPRKRRTDYGEISNLIRGFSRQPKPTLEITCKDSDEFRRVRQSVWSARDRLHKNQELDSKLHTETDPSTFTVRVFK